MRSDRGRSTGSRRVTGGKSASRHPAPGAAPPGNGQGVKRCQPAGGVRVKRAAVHVHTRGNQMKQIVSAAIAALFAIVTFSAPAADVTAPADTPKAEKKTTK